MDIRKVYKKGHSLAVCIPAELVKQLKLQAGDNVAWVNGAIIKIVEVTEIKQGGNNLYK